MKCHFIEATEDLVLRVDVIYREIGVDDHVADDNPVAVEVAQLQGDRVVLSHLNLTVGDPAQGRDSVSLGLDGSLYDPA